VRFDETRLTLSILNGFSEKKNRKEKPIVKWRDMQKMIHGADDIATSSKLFAGGKPPALEPASDGDEAENSPEFRRESESDSEAASNGSADGLTWLDGPPPNLVGMEREVFTVEDTVDVGAPYLLDLLDSAPTTARSQPGNRSRALPPPVPSALVAPKDKDWSIW
jgi:hypothetical protein